MEPRKAQDIRRIIGRAKSKTAESDLREYDRLLGEGADVDCALNPSAAQRKAKAARERRLKLLGKRLLGTTR